MSAVITILGVDPALTCTGYGLVRVDGNRYEAIDFGTVAPPAQAPIAERLLRIHEALSDVIRDARPDEVAVEDFIVGHVRAAVAVGETRAVALLAAAERVKSPLWSRHSSISRNPLSPRTPPTRWPSPSATRLNGQRSAISNQ